MSERVEIRRNEDRSIDEVLLYVDDRCVFHLEQNSKHSWYLGLYPDGVRGEDDEQFGIWSKGTVRVRRYLDVTDPGDAKR